MNFITEINVIPSLNQLVLIVVTYDFILMTTSFKIAGDLDFRYVTKWKTKHIYYRRNSSKI